MKTTGFLVAVVSGFCLASALSLYAGAGSLDITFNPGTGADGQIRCIALQTNGQIVIGGDFTHFNGVNQSHVARLNADGSLDTSFNPGVGPTGNNPVVDAIAVQPNGEILVGGNFIYVNGLSWNPPALFRADGSLDTSFNTSGSNGSGVPYGSGSVYSIALQTDGKVLVGGSFNYVAIGNGNSTNLNNLARFNSNSSLDVGFKIGAGANGSVTSIGMQSNGQIIVGGNFTSINNSNMNFIARLNTDGSLDGTFNALIQSGNVNCFAIGPQDKILIGGTFTSINGYSRNYVARLNSNGNLDTSFNPGLGANAAVSSIAVQTNGQVIISGNFSAYNGASLNCGLARLNSNGSLDAAFNPGTGPNGIGSYTIVASQPDGRTLIAGSFIQFNGTNINRIARLNSDTSSTTLNLLNPGKYFGMYLQGTVSNTYRVEYSSTLNPSSLWSPLTNLTLQSNPQFVADPASTGGRFYRAVQILP